MKKISYNDAAYIFGYKKHYLFEKYCCYWTIRMNNDVSGFMCCRIKKPIYVLLFLPVCLLTFFYCLWDGGLKNFEILPIIVGCHNMVGAPNDDESTMFGRVRKIWAK